MPYRPKAPGKPKPKGRPVVRRRPALKRKVAQKGGQRKKQRNVYKDDQAVGDLALFKYKGGAKIASDLKGAWKVLKSNQQNNIYYFEYCNRFMTPATAGSPPGYLNLGTTWSGNAVGNGSVTLPLMLISLSAAPNITAGSINQPTALWFMSRPSASGNITFSSNGQWSPSNTAGNSGGVQSYPGQADILKAINAKFVLYGTTTRPVKWRIDIIQLSESYLHPDKIYNNANDSEGAAITQFYSELIREYSYSPATFSDSNATKGKIKYLKSWTHLIQPRSTAEAQVQENFSGNMETTSAIAHAHSFNLYHKFNRSQRYNWDDNVATQEPTGNSYDVQPIVQGVNRPDVTYKARVYMMIRALAPSATFNGMAEPTITPSLDFSCRSYHTNLG